MSVDWTGWPPGWPVTERFLQLPQTCRRCGRQLQGAWGRGTPTGWMHRECAVAYAVECTAAAPPVYVLTELEDETLEP